MLETIILLGAILATAYYFFVVRPAAALKSFERDTSAGPTAAEERDAALRRKREALKAAKQTTRGGPKKHPHHGPLPAKKSHKHHASAAFHDERCLGALAGFNHRVTGISLSTHREEEQVMFAACDRSGSVKVFYLADMLDQQAVRALARDALKAFAAKGELSSSVSSSGEQKPLKCTQAVATAQLDGACAATAVALGSTTLFVAADDAGAIVRFDIDDVKRGKGAKKMHASQATTVKHGQKGDVDRLWCLDSRGLLLASGDDASCHIHIRDRCLKTLEMYDTKQVKHFDVVTTRAGEHPDFADHPSLPHAERWLAAAAWMSGIKLLEVKFARVTGAFVHAKVVNRVHASHSHAVAIADDLHLVAAIDVTHGKHIELYHTKVRHSLDEDTKLVHTTELEADDVADIRSADSAGVARDVVARAKFSPDGEELCVSLGGTLVFFKVDYEKHCAKGMRPPKVALRRMARLAAAHDGEPIVQMEACKTAVVTRCAAGRVRFWRW